MNKVLLMVYPCRNGDKIFLGGKPVLNRLGNHVKDHMGVPMYEEKEYTLRSDGKNKVITAWEAQNIMADEGFFEVTPGSCPITASGVVEV